jgi:hypothetical protein
MSKKSVSRGALLHSLTKFEALIVGGNHDLLLDKSGHGETRQYWHSIVLLLLEEKFPLEPFHRFLDAFQSKKCVKHSSYKFLRTIFAALFKP